MAVIPSTGQEFRGIPVRILHCYDIHKPLGDTTPAVKKQILVCIVLLWSFQVSNQIHEQMSIRGHVKGASPMALPTTLLSVGLLRLTLSMFNCWRLALPWRHACGDAVSSWYLGYWGVSATPQGKASTSRSLSLFPPALPWFASPTLHHFLPFLLAMRAPSLGSKWASEEARSFTAWGLNAVNVVFCFVTFVCYFDVYLLFWHIEDVKSVPESQRERN